MLAVLGVWQWAGDDPDSGAFISSPAAVFAQLAIWVRDADRWHDLLLTLSEAAAGLALGVTAAVILGSLIGVSPRLARFFDPYITAANALPKLALAPLFIVLFGIGMSSKVYFVAASIFFIPFFNIYTGFRAMDRVYLQNVRMLGGGPRWQALDVYVPSLLGTVVASLRVTVAWALLAAVLSEFIAASGGIGYVINQGQSSLRNEVVLAGIVVISALVLLIDRLLVVVERRYAAWQLP